MCRNGTWFLVALLFLSCSQSPQKDVPPIEPVSPHWTLIISESTLLGLEIARPDHKADGWYEQSLEIPLSRPDSILLAAHQHRVARGKIQERVLTLLTADEQQHKKVYMEMFARLDSLYKPSAPTTGFATWKASSAVCSLIEVELIDGLILFGRPEVITRWTVHEDRLYED